MQKFPVQCFIRLPFFLIFLLLDLSSIVRAQTLTLNPDISVIVDSLYNYRVNENTTTAKNLTRDQFLLREVELGLQANVDPFTRADIFLGFHQDEIEIEEAYATLLTLPYGLGARMGLFRPAVGKLNLTHFGEIMVSEPPLVYESLFGGEEGISGAGLEVSSLVELPWYSQIRFGAFNLRQKAGLADIPSYMIHWKQFFDFSDEKNFEAGLVLGKRLAQGRDLIGLDLTYRWRPEKLGLYRSLWAQSEFFLAPGSNGQSSRWGGFGLAQWQLNRQWYVGGKIDLTEDLASAQAESDFALAGILTYFPSEFSRYRIELRRKASDSGDETALFFQATFSLGPHRPHGF